MYIGKTIDIKRRMSEHKRDKRWLQEGGIKRITYALTDTEREMDRAELYYINTVKPRCNKAGFFEEALTFKVKDLRFRDYEECDNMGESINSAKYNNDMSDLIESFLGVYAYVIDASLEKDNKVVDNLYGDYETLLYAVKNSIAFDIMKKTMSSEFIKNILDREDIISIIVESGLNRIKWGNEANKQKCENSKTLSDCVYIINTLIQVYKYKDNSNDFILLSFKELLGNIKDENELERIIPNLFFNIIDHFSDDGKIDTLKSILVVLEKKINESDDEEIEDEDLIENVNQRQVG